MATAPVFTNGASVEYIAGQENTEYVLELPVGTLPGDIFLIELVAAFRGATLSSAEGSMPQGIITLAAMSSPGAAAVSAGSYLYVVPESVPVSIKFVWSTAYRGSLVWDQVRGGSTSLPTDGVASSGWTAGGTSSVTAPSVSTSTTDTLHVVMISMGSGSTTVTPPDVTPAWTARAQGAQRRGYIADRGAKAAAGATGSAVFTMSAVNEFRAVTVAIRAAGAAAGVGAIPGVSASGITGPTGRMQKPIARLQWVHDGKNAAVLPTATGWRIFADLSNPIPGLVVESSLAYRPAIAYRNGRLYVLRQNATTGRMNIYDAANGYAVLFQNVAIQSLAPNPDGDANPLSVAFSESGHLYHGFMTAGKAYVARRAFNESTAGTFGRSQYNYPGALGTESGMVALVSVGTDMLAIITPNDGLLPRKVFRFAETLAGASIVGSWVEETLPDLPAGVTGDDHLAVTKTQDGRVLAVSKTTNDGIEALLIYVLARSVAGVWTMHTVVSDPDDDGGTSPGYSRPTIGVEYDQVVVMYGSIYAPKDLSFRTASLSDLNVWTSRQTLLGGPDYSDSAQIPDSEFIRLSGSQYPVLAHKRDTGEVIKVMRNTRNPTATTQNVTLGAQTSNRIAVAVKTSSIASARYKIATNEDMTEGVIFGAPATPDADGYIHMLMDGLSPNTQYHYGIEYTLPDASVIPATRLGSPRTHPTPGQPATFSWGWGSCFDHFKAGLTSSIAGPFARMMARKPLFWFHLGDYHYKDNLTSSQASHRADFEEVLASSVGLRMIHAEVPVYVTPSDHCGGGGNNAASGPWTLPNLNARKQVIPIPDDRPVADAVYHSFEVGRILFIVTDTRSKAVAGVTRMGEAQKTWFREQMMRPHPVKVWVQEATFIDNLPLVADGDKWQDVPTEKAWIGNVIDTEGVGLIFTIHGDQHAISADDGSHNPHGGFPSFCAAPFRNNTSIKTLNATDWSNGIVPNPVGDEAQQYGYATATDDGTTIAIELGGYDSADVKRISMTLTTTTAPVGPPVTIKVKTAEGLVSILSTTIKDGAGSVRPITRGAFKTSSGAIVPLV